jgi:hypothetical protein
LHNKKVKNILLIYIISDKEIDEDLKLYKYKFLESRANSENKLKIKIADESILDENFIIILCELFHAYIGSILLDSRDIAVTYMVIKSIMDEYLKNNATKDTYTEHPKVIILDEFFKRRHYFKSLKEK